MPTDREREYYRMGYSDGINTMQRGKPQILGIEPPKISKPKRKLSAWNKFVKANSKKKIFQYANGKLKLKKMGIAFRKKRK
jgi:hypothetical protein